MAITPAALTVDRTEACSAFTGQVERFVQSVGRLDDLELLAASRCHGWAVLDVVVHVRVGLEEMLRGVTAPTDDAPTVDAATYWSAWAAQPDRDDEVDGILWTRRTASAYPRPSGAVRHLRAAADAVLAAALPPAALRFQGQVIAGGDFLATWAVELAVHHVDLGLHLDLAPPTDAALRLTRATIEALLGTPVPPSVSDLDALLVGAGRVPVPPGLPGLRHVLG